MNGLRPRPRADRDAGMTLVELLVAMLVSGIVATMVASVTIQAFRIQRQTLLREKDSTTASLAMETISRDVRQALSTQVSQGNTLVGVNAFSVTTATSMTLVTWASADPILVTYTLSGGVLTRTQKAADSSGQGTGSTFAGSGATTTRTVATNLASTALFTYHRSDGMQSTSYTVAADRATIDSVIVAFTIDSDTGSLPGTSLTNTVVCLNL